MNQNVESARLRKLVATRFVLAALITEVPRSDLSPSGVFIPASAEPMARPSRSYVGSTSLPRGRVFASWESVGSREQPKNHHGYPYAGAQWGTTATRRSWPFSAMDLA